MLKIKKVRYCGMNYVPAPVRTTLGTIAVLTLVLSASASASAEVRPFPPGLEAKMGKSTLRLR